MKSIYELTTEEKKRCKPEKIKELIEINNSLLRVWSITDETRKELEKENKYLNELLIFLNGGDS